MEGDSEILSVSWHSASVLHRSDFVSIHLCLIWLLMQPTRFYIDTTRDISLTRLTTVCNYLFWIAIAASEVWLMMGRVLLWSEEQVEYWKALVSKSSNRHPTNTLQRVCRAMASLPVYVILRLSIVLFAFWYLSRAERDLERNS